MVRESTPFPVAGTSRSAPERSAAPAGLDTLAAALPAGEAAVRGFAAGVAIQLQAGPLTHDQRHRLFARAAVLGLGRFEANLIIAIAERQAGGGLTPAATPVAAPPLTLPRGLAWATAATVQAAIILAAWALL